MSSQLSQFKQSQIYDWDTEPVLERPSAFFHPESPGARPRRIQRRKTRGSTWLVLVVLVVASGAAGLKGMVPMLQHMFG